MMKRLLVVSIITICFYSGLVIFPLTCRAGEAKLIGLCTTFPIYQITRNVTQDREGLKVDLMLPSQLGCPHDYALTPQDMQKLLRADILVVNGLGMEEFLGAPVEKAKPKIKVIDSSAGIKETLEYSGEHHEHGHHHHHAGTNPHLFASPRMTARLAMNIAAELSKVDPNGSATYFKNAQTYAETMNKLADEMTALGKRLKNNRIVQPHGIFDYLARDMGLKIVAVMQAHGQEPSAAEMIQLVKTVKEKSAGAIFTEPQYPEKVGRTLSKETGVPVALLDPVATGPEDSPLTYYETVMRKNMKTLETTLGVK
jgi:ABC-type Zn uptake system ZnuABC Zn-binding protein ZnuA